MAILNFNPIAIFQTKQAFVGCGEPEPAGMVPCDTHIVEIGIRQFFRQRQLGSVWILRTKNTVRADPENRSLWIAVRSFKWEKRPSRVRAPVVQADDLPGRYVADQ